MRQAVARRVYLVLVGTMVVVASLSTWLVKCAQAYQLTDDLGSPRHLQDGELLPPSGRYAAGIQSFDRKI